MLQGDIQYFLRIKPTTWPPESWCLARWLNNNQEMEINPNDSWAMFRYYPADHIFALQRALTNTVRVNYSYTVVRWNNYQDMYASGTTKRWCLHWLNLGRPIQLHLDRDNLVGDKYSIMFLPSKELLPIFHTSCMTTSLSQPLPTFNWQKTLTWQIQWSLHG